MYTNLSLVVSGGAAPPVPDVRPCRRRRHFDCCWYIVAVADLSHLVLHADSLAPHSLSATLPLTGSTALGRHLPDPARACTHTHPLPHVSSRRQRPRRTAAARCAAPRCLLLVARSRAPNGTDSRGLMLRWRSGTPRSVDCPSPIAAQSDRAAPPPPPPLCCHSGPLVASTAPAPGAMRGTV